ncbi:hypothetical protein N9O85_02395 [Porticoccaceae bacterium]|nr:hypothetical protein [Porticoccaceae bacterium]
MGKSMAALSADFDPSSKDEFRHGLRAIISYDFEVCMAIVGRLSLIQLSCSKIYNSFSGVSSEINEFRYLAERYVALADLLNRFEKATGSLLVTKLDHIDELSALSHKSFGTRFNWDLWDIPFEEMKDTSYSHSEHSKGDDRTSVNIMTLITRVEKSGMPGLRAFYTFCCEFVHPNIGDMVSSTRYLESLMAEDGKYLQRYVVAPVEMPKVGFFGSSREGDSSEFMAARSYMFAAKILEELNEKIPLLLKLVSQAKIIRERWLHKVVKRSRMLDSGDLCPCGSGSTVKGCAGTVRWMKLVK